MSIRVEVGRLCCEQRGRRPAEFRILSFVAGGPEPQEGGGLGRAGTLGSKVLWHQSSDESPACVEETVATEERFCFVLVELYTCHSMSETTKSIKFTICQVLTTYAEANTEANSLQL